MLPPLTECSCTPQFAEAIPQSPPPSALSLPSSLPFPHPLPPSIFLVTHPSTPQRHAFVLRSFNKAQISTCLVHHRVLPLSKLASPRHLFPYLFFQITFLLLLHSPWKNTDDKEGSRESREGREEEGERGVLDRGERERARPIANINGC